MGNRVKGRSRSRPKPKSVKAKINRQMGSKRRTQRMGKELKKGQKGAAASFLTRAQVYHLCQDLQCQFLVLPAADNSGNTYVLVATVSNLQIAALCPQSSFACFEFYLVFCIKESGTNS